MFVIDLFFFHESYARMVSLVNEGKIYRFISLFSFLQIWLIFYVVVDSESFSGVFLTFFCMEKSVADQLN